MQATRARDERLFVHLSSSTAPFNQSSLTRMVVGCNGINRRRCKPRSKTSDPILPCTALWKHYFGFNEFRLWHFFRILECFNMRYISDISYARIMKYGNPDIYFLRFFWIFLDFPDIWVKVHNNIMFLNSYPISCRKYYSMTIKVAVNPEKILKIFFVSKFSSNLT